MTVYAVRLAPYKYSYLLTYLLITLKSASMIIEIFLHVNVKSGHVKSARVHRLKLTIASVTQVTFTIFKPTQSHVKVRYNLRKQPQRIKDAHIKNAITHYNEIKLSSSSSFITSTGSKAVTYSTKQAQ